jgi:hypothetical protein
MILSWGEVISASLKNIWFAIANFIPEFLAAVVIFIVGWIVASILGKVVGQVIRMTRVDSALKAAKVDQVVEKAGFHLDAGLFVGTLVKWFFIVVALVAALDVLGLSSVTSFLQNVVLNYLPSVIMAVLIIMVAAVVAEAMQRIVVGSAKAADIKSANLVGNITKWAIWAFAILTALLQLGIAVSFINTLFTGIIIAVSLALGLAFGLGGQDAAAKYIEQVKNDVSDR